MWWGGVPAKLKGLFDRAFLPGRTFDTRTTNWMGMPAAMLSGRTARIIVTSDTPDWFLRLAYRNAMPRQLRDQVFGIVGIKPVRIAHFTGASHPEPGKVDRWIARARKYGAAAR